MDEFQRRHFWIEKRRKFAEDLDKKLQKMIFVSQETNRQEERTLEGKEDIPLEVFKQCIKDYRGSKTRREIYQALYRKMEPMSTGYISSPERIRNFLALELYIQGVGVRTDVVRNLKVKELINGEPIENGKYFVVGVQEHKTASHYGKMKIHVEKDLFGLLNEFVAILYPQYFARNRGQNIEASLEDYVFTTNQGKQLDRLQCCMDLWRSVVPESWGKYHPKPYDFRRYSETIYQSSENPDIRKNAPAIIGHSEDTAKKFYVTYDAKMKQQAAIRKEILDDDEDPVDDPRYQPDFNEIDEYDIPDDLEQPGTSKGLSFVQKKKQELKDMRANAANERRQASHVRTNRNFLTPEERNFLKQKFSMHAGRGTLHAADIKAARVDETFEAIFNDIKERENYDSEKVVKLLQSSFRSMHRPK